jgi:LysM repeat protein
MHSDNRFGIADRPRSREPGLALICLALALLGGALVATIGMPRLPSAALHLPTGIELELLLRSPGAEQVTWVLVVASLAAWLLWAWLAVTVVLRVIVLLCERAAAGAAWVASLRTVSDRLTLPVVRRAVDASLAGLLLARVAGGWTTPPIVLAEAQNAEVRLLDPQPGEALRGGELLAGDFLYTVQSGDSLGKIAERYYGDWAAYERIYEANRQRQQQDGRVLEDARAIYPGWTLLIPGPSEAVKQDEEGQQWCVVQPGDSLSGIAAHLLGDERRWPELFDLNRGVAQLPDGRILTNPQLVWPGLRLRLPGSGVQAIGTTEPVQAVRSYYQLLGQGDLAGAAEMMRDGPGSLTQASLPPTPEGRAAVQRAQVLNMDAYERQATVAVELEVTVDSRTPSQRYLVHWQLARGPEGWRLARADVGQP